MSLYFLEYLTFIGYNLDMIGIVDVMGISYKIYCQ